MQESGMRFIRKGGRIIPIKAAKREGAVAKEIVTASARQSGIIAGATVASLGSLYGAGRLHKFAMATGNKKLNTLAKIFKFGSVATTGLVAGGSLASIDKKVNDERSKLFNIGSQATSAIGIAAQLGIGYGVYRLGKRFEYAGKMGVNLFKKENWKTLKKLDSL